jgi:DNA-binding beta-propeller fold protein YncE
MSFFTRRAALALALSLAAAAGCTEASQPRRPADLDASAGLPAAREPTRPAHGTVVRIDPVAREVVDVYRVGGDPLQLAIASGHVWVMNFVQGTLSRIDPSAEHATTFTVDGQTAAMTSDGRDVWVTHDGNTLSRLDGATGQTVSSFRLASEPLFELRDAGFLAISGGYAWLTVPDLDDSQAPQSLWRVDTRTGDVLEKIPIGGNPSPPLVDGRFAWIASLVNADLTRVDLRTGRSVRLNSVTYAYALTAGAGSVWIGTAIPGDVVRIDPASRNILARIDADGDVRGMGYGGGRVWATTESGVTEIDSSTNQIVATIPLGSFEPDTGSTAIGSLNGSLWISIE